MMAVVGFGGFLAMLTQQVSFGTMGQRLALRVRQLLFKVCVCVCWGGEMGGGSPRSVGWESCRFPGVFSGSSLFVDLTLLPCYSAFFRSPS